MEVQLRPASGHRGAEAVHRCHLVQRPWKLERVTQNPLCCVRQREPVHRVQAGHQAGLHCEGDLHPGPQPPQHAGASCHVMSCHVMSCHVMSCHVMSSAGPPVREHQCRSLQQHDPLQWQAVQGEGEDHSWPTQTSDVSTPFILFNFIYSAS